MSDAKGVRQEWEEYRATFGDNFPTAWEEFIERAFIAGWEAMAREHRRVISDVTREHNRDLRDACRETAADARREMRDEPYGTY